MKVEEANGTREPAAGSFWGSKEMTLPAAAVLGLAVCLGCGSSEDGGNRPPSIVEAVPRVGTTVPEGKEIGVIMEDPNPDDQLYYRWVIDYPPFNPDATRIHDSPPVASGERVAFQPDCTAHSLARDVAGHDLILLVSDRPFARSTEQASSSAEAVEEVSADANVLQLTWDLQINCD